MIPHESSSRTCSFFFLRALAIFSFSRTRCLRILVPKIPAAPAEPGNDRPKSMVGTACHGVGGASNAYPRNVDSQAPIACFMLRCTTLAKTGCPQGQTAGLRAHLEKTNNMSSDPRLGIHSQNRCQVEPKKREDWERTAGLGSAPVHQIESGEVERFSRWPWKDVTHFCLSQTRSETAITGCQVSSVPCQD